MEEGRINILKANLGDQSNLIQEIYEKIQSRADNYRKNEDRTLSLAYYLHNLYCAFEDIMKLVASEFENRVSEGSDWHTRLLRRMTVNIPDIRPALFSQESYLSLDELRGFRHWFRHAYTHRINPDKLEIVLKESLKLREIFEADIQKFLEELSE